MKTSASFLMVTGALLLLGGLAACSDDDDSNTGGSAGSATGGTGGGETGGTGGGETGGTGGGETGGTGGGETGGTGGGETGGTGGGETGGTGGGETGGTGGGETGGTGGGTGGLDCAEACANIASANCANADDEATCTDDCETEMGAHLTECGTEASAFVSCVATVTFTCDQNDEPIPQGCVDEEKAYELCAACLPEAEDDACETCIKTDCCTELKDMIEDYNTTTEGAYMDCNEAHCVDDCGSG